jgi:thioredoxin
MKLLTCAECGAKNRVDETKLANSEAKCGRCGTKLDAKTGNGAAAGPTILTDGSFQQEVLNASGPPTLVDFWAPWCGPCRVVGPIVDQLAAESNGRYRVAKLNVDDNPVTASRYQVASIPTLLIFNNGNVIDRIVGAQPKQAIVERLKHATS